MSERETTGMVSAFTPVFDVIARNPHLGPVAALVFGRVWRYCRMNGVCRASRERMAREVGLHRKTFDRWLTRLCEKGYLEDMATWTRGRSHWYRDTGKVKMPDRKGVGERTEGLNGAQLGQRVQTLGTESPNGWDRKSHKDTMREKRERQQHAGVFASSPSSLLCSQELPGSADVPSQSEPHPPTGDPDNGVAANLRAMAEYGVARTREAVKTAARPGMTPDLIHAWAQYGQNRGDVRNLPAWLASVLPHVHGPPPPGNGNGRAGRKHRRDEYGGYTMSQRDALWAQHKDRYLALVAQGLDPHRQGPAFAKALGLTDEESHMLHAAYSAYQSEQQPPLGPSYLDEDD